MKCYLSPSNVHSQDYSLTHPLPPKYGPGYWLQSRIPGSINRQKLRMGGWGWTSGLRTGMIFKKESLIWVLQILDMNIRVTRLMWKGRDLRSQRLWPDHIVSGKHSLLSNSAWVLTGMAWKLELACLYKWRHLSPLAYVFQQGSKFEQSEMCRPWLQTVIKKEWRAIVYS